MGLLSELAAQVDVNLGLYVLLSLDFAEFSCGVFSFCGSCTCLQKIYLGIVSGIISV